MARYCRFRLSFNLSSFAVLLSLCTVALTYQMLAQTASPGSNTATLATPAQATFVVAPAFSISGAPTSVASGNLDGDGKLDLVIANNSAGKVTVLLGKGNGKFAAPVNYSVGNHPTGILLGDFNGDGKLDVAVCNETDGTISVLLGNGDGTLQKPVTYAAVSDPVYLAAGDFNGDGKLDLVVAGNASQSIGLLLNDGKGNFSKATPYSTGKSPLSVAVADFDGDGRADVASANADGTISVLLGRGDGTFRTITSLNVGSAPLSSIVAGDLSGDGKPDLAVSQAGTKLVVVLVGNGDGTFQSGVPYTVGNNPASLAITDINGDSTPDLVTVNQSGNSFSVLVGNGDGSFKPSLDFAVGNSPRAVAAGDFDGDGHVDLAVVNFADSTVSVPLGNGDGTFKAARAYNVDLSRKSLASGDLVGDGKTDLVVTNFCGTDTTCSGNGTVSVLLAVGDGSYELSGSYSLGVGPLSAVLADLNGDKKLDLVVANRGDKTISVLLGNGDGTFQSALTYAAGNSPAAIAVADLNKDKKLDLVVAGDCGSNVCSQPGSINVFMGNGDGSFQSATSYSAGYSPASIAVGDVNGDGNPDLVVANACGTDSTCQSKGTGTLLVGNGKGAFTAKTDLQFGNGPSSVALSDLNGKGSLDLVVAYRADNKVAVHHGNGDGTFKSAVTYPVGISPSSLVISDFNGDGKRDVAVANFKSSTVSVLFGNGDGTLQTAVHYPVGVGPESLVAVDSSGNGNADLVAANGNGGAKPLGSDVTVLSNLSPLGKGGPLGVTASNTVLQSSSSGNTSNVNDTVTFTATVSGSSGTPTGHVSFTNNGHTIPECPAPVLLTGGVATCLTPSLPAGADVILATYNGDPTYDSSNDSLTQTVNPIASKTVLQTSGSTSNVNDSVTFTATVSASNLGGLSPAGHVSFTSNGLAIPECLAPLLLSGGVATCTTTSLVAGADTIKAVYNGDQNFTTSNDSLTQTVNPIASKTVLTTSGSPSNVGVAVTFTATVSANNPGTLSPAGHVSFTSNGQAIPECSAPVLLTGGVAACTTTSLVSGTDAIKAVYNGDKNFTSSNDSLNQTVNVVPSKIVLQTSGSPSNVNSTVTFTATMSGSLTVPTGHVSFTSNGQTIPECAVPVPLVAGVATCATQSLTGGSDFIKATYNGDSTYSPSSDSLTQTVIAIASKTVLTSSSPGNTSNVNGTVTFTATVTASSSGGLSPTGHVSFTSNGQAIPECASPVLLVSGVATCMTASLPAGSDAIKAVYNGDKNFTSSNDSLTQTVTAIASKTVLTSSSPGNTSNVNGTVTFTATVTASSSGGLSPTGHVSFTSNGQAIPECASPVLLVSGVATCMTASLPAGADAIKAVYNGDQNFTTSNDSLTQTVTAIASKTVLQTSGSPSNVNGTVTFTATVTASSPGGLSPTGHVSFTSNGQAIPECAAPVLLTGGVATCTTNSLTAGADAIKAVYNGDKNFTSSNDSLTQTVNPIASNTVLQTSGSPSNVNGTVKFTATVTAGSPGSLSPTGHVSFTSNGQTIPECAAPVLLTGGVATCTTNSLTAGADAIKAVYNGDKNFNSSSNSLTQTVIAIASKTVLQTTGSPSNVNVTVTFSATVTASSSGGLSPTGHVSFTSNGLPITGCPAPVLMAGGVATCTTNSLAAGADAIKAVYNGDNNFTPSNDSLTQTVTVIASKTVLQTTGSPSNVNGTVTFTATVTASSPGGLSPTGHVSFTSNALAIPECASPVLLVSGVATCTTNSLLAGTDAIKAVYNGDNNFTSSNDALTQVVNIIASNVALKSSSPGNASNVNATVTFTATVTASSPGGLKPAGHVSFTYNSGSIPECPAPVLLVNGVATCTTTHLAGGVATIAANYNGDPNFNPGNTTLLQMVNRTDTVTTVSSTLNPSVSTQRVTINATVLDVISGPFSPTGKVTFTSGGAVISDCVNPAPLSVVGTATCTTTTLASGSDSLQAAYNSDTNFNPSSATLPQVVEDFAFLPSPTFPVPVAPGSSNIAGTSLFSALNQAVAGTATPLNGFTDTLAVLCNVMPVVSNPLTCSLDPSTLPGGSGSVLVTLTAGTAGAPTPPGFYTVTLTAIDQSVKTLSHTTTVIVNVISTAAPISVVPGGSGATSATFAGPPGVTVTFSENTLCPLFNGSGLGVTIPAGGGPLSLINASCVISPNPQTVTFNSNGVASLQLTVTTTGAQLARMNNPSGISASLWLGMPAILLIGPLRRKKLTRNKILQFLGVLLIMVGLMQGIGCGGGFTKPPPATTNPTPTGSYQVLVQGIGSDRLTYSAIVPLNVAH